MQKQIKNQNESLDSFFNTEIQLTVKLYPESVGVYSQYYLFTCVCTTMLSRLSTEMSVFTAVDSQATHRMEETVNNKKTFVCLPQCRLHITNASIKM